jgi:membrane protease YdiL (CAAX protease family)
VWYSRAVDGEDSLPVSGPEPDGTEPTVEREERGPIEGPALATAPAIPAAARFRSLLEVLICSGFPTQLAIGGVLALAGVSPLDRHGRLSPPYVFILSLADSAAVIGFVVWFLRSRGERPGLVLLGRRRVWRECLVGIALIPAVFGIVILVLAFVYAFAPWLHNVARNPLEGLVRTPLNGLMLAFVTLVSGGFREEIQRAFILHRFEQHLGGGLLGLLLFGVVFGLGHVLQGWDVAITVAALGVLWSVVYLRRRSIAASVVSHAGFDVTQVFRYTFWGA